MGVNPISLKTNFNWWFLQMTGPAPRAAAGVTLFSTLTSEFEDNRWVAGGFEPQLIKVAKDMAN